MPNTSVAFGSNSSSFILLLSVKTLGCYVASGRTAARPPMQEEAAKCCTQLSRPCSPAVSVLIHADEDHQQHTSAMDFWKRHGCRISLGNLSTGQRSTKLKTRKARFNHAKDTYMHMLMYNCSESFEPIGQSTTRDRGRGTGVILYTGEVLLVLSLGT